jgi:UDP:flavonoid glycosyltransferase YjiC (YdhE family)
MKTSKVNMSRRFLFSTASGYGHFHPVVPLARALKEVGHEVAFAASPSLQPIVEASGFAVLPVGGNLATDPEYQQLKARRETMPVSLETEMLVYSTLFCGIAPRVRTPDLVAVARSWQPDMLIREGGDYAGAIAAEYLGLPHATISFAASLKGLSIFERGAAEHLAPIRESWGLPPDPDLTSLYRYLFLAYSPPSFAMQDVADDGGGPGAPNSIPATTHFIRPQFFDQAAHSGQESLPDWLEQLPSAGRPTIYVTLGTEANSEPGVYPFVLQTIIEGLRDAPVNLIVTLGRDRDPEDFGPQPPNVHIERYIPQSLLLPKCDLAVMHGGSNSLLQALDIGLPMVLVPLIADQWFNADVAQSLQLGKVVQTWQPGLFGQLDLGQLTPAAIHGAVEEVLNNPIYRQNVGRLQAEMHALPDLNHAVGLVEQVIVNSP